MVNMLKVLAAAIVLLAIIAFGVLGKKASKIFIFRSAKPTGNESFWVEIISFGLVAFFAISHYVQNDPEVNSLMWFGLAVFLAGGLVQITARKHLHDDHAFEERLMSGFEAAQTGLYAKLRHPSKSALLLISLGLCLLTDSIWAFGIYAVLFMPAVLFRINAEEQRLLDQFGERYEAYREDSKRIIPGIY